MEGRRPQDSGVPWGQPRASESGPGGFVTSVVATTVRSSLRQQGKQTPPRSAISLSDLAIRLTPAAWREVATPPRPEGAATSHSPIGEWPIPGCGWRIHGTDTMLPAKWIRGHAMNQVDTMAGTMLDEEASFDGAATIGTRGPRAAGHRASCACFAMMGGPAWPAARAAAAATSADWRCIPAWLADAPIGEAADKAAAQYTDGGCQVRVLILTLLWRGWSQQGASPHAAPR